MLSTDLADFGWPITMSWMLWQAWRGIPGAGTLASAKEPVSLSKQQLPDLSPKVTVDWTPWRRWQGDLCSEGSPGRGRGLAGNFNLGQASQILVLGPELALK